MPRNNELPSYQTLLKFQEVYLRAIALAWSDDTFKKQLLENAEKTFQDYFGYICPWNVALSVVEPYPTGSYKWNSDLMCWNLPKNSIGIGIPKKPDEDNQPVALAAYNDAGPTYLFTCC